MSQVKSKRTKKHDTKSVGELIRIIKRLHKREDDLIQHIRDLEFYIDTLESEVFDGDTIQFEADFDIPNTPNENIIKLHTIDEVLGELKEKKKKKKRK